MHVPLFAPNIRLISPVISVCVERLSWGKMYIAYFTKKKNTKKLAFFNNSLTMVRLNCAHRKRSRQPHETVHAMITDSKRNGERPKTLT